jgi:hypothetical protein
MLTVSTQYTEMMNLGSNDQKYKSGMRPPKNFIRLCDPIVYDFKLPEYSYGDEKTKDVARRITDLVVF